MTSDRLQRIQRQLEKRRIDALLLTSLDNIRYTSGFTGSTATAVITRDRAIILVDSRYILQASQECPQFERRLFPGDIMQAASDLVNELALARLGFEADYVTYTSHRKLRSMIAKTTKLVATSRAVEEVRIVKEPHEIETIRQATAIADECFSWLLSRIKPGMTERQIALDIYLFIYGKGARLAFDSIVASGPHAAFPHFKPTDSPVQPGQILKLDFGAIVNRYGSDLTRTIFLGQPDAKQREVYGIVLEAQLRAIAAIRPGKLGKEIDAVARDFITSKGYGENFGHGLGHSLGTGGHEGPGLTQTSETVLAPGMAMTVEPGIYIEGWGGIRIEDDVLITDSGAEVLTKATKEIVVVR